MAEDEFLVADALVQALEEQGAVVLGPASSVSSVLVLASFHESIDAAVLDINLRGELIYLAADKLIARGVPVIFATAYDEQAIPSAYANTPRCEKPVSTDELVAALRRLEARGEV